MGVIKEKTIKSGKKNCIVKLIIDGRFFVVTVDDDIYYRGARELFAVQRFNSI